jgi:hypothetical protein
MEFIHLTVIFWSDWRIMDERFHESISSSISKMEAFTDRWAFLRPWCPPLRGRLALGLDDQAVDDKFVLYVKMAKTQDEAQPEAIRCLRDSFLLLSLVAQVDRFAWARTLFTHCEVEINRSDARMKAPDMVMARLDLVVHLETVDDDDDWQIKMLLRFFAMPETPPSGAFLVAVRQTLARGPRDSIRSNQLIVPVGVSVYVGYFDDHFGLDALLTRFCGALGEFRSPDDQLLGFAMGDRMLKCGYQLELLMLHLLDPLLTPKVVDALEKVMAWGSSIVISSLSSSTCLQQGHVTDSARASQIIGRMLERMLCATDWTGEGKFLTHQVELVAMNAHKIGRVSSAISEARTTQDLLLSFLRFEMTPAVQQRVWECLAYGLFSKRAKARSSISRVHMKGLDVSEADAEVVAAVLAAHDPAKHIFGQHEVDEPPVIAPDEHSWGNAMVAQGSLVTMRATDPHDRFLRASAWWELKTDVNSVQVLEDHGANPNNDRIVRVLIPGYGVCDVERDEIIPVGGEPDRRKPTTGISELEMTFSRDAGATAGVPRLLELIGASLTSLSLHIPSGETLLLGDVLLFCPNLTSLMVGIQTTVSAASFLEAYRARNMRIISLYCLFDDLPANVGEVSDATSLLAQNLKRFMLYAVDFQHMLTTERLEELSNVLTAVRHMLLVNRTLQYVEIMAPRQLMEQSRALATWFHNEPLPDVRSAFPLKYRLAFLSVFSPCRVHSGIRHVHHEASRGAPRPRTIGENKRSVIALSRTALRLVPLPSSRAKRSHSSSPGTSYAAPTVDARQTSGTGTSTPRGICWSC